MAAILPDLASISTAIERLVESERKLKEQLEEMNNENAKLKAELHTKNEQVSKLEKEKKPDNQWMIDLYQKMPSLFYKANNTYDYTTSPHLTEYIRTNVYSDEDI